jgi:hypothetical protein
LVAEKGRGGDGGSSGDIGKGEISDDGRLMRHVACRHARSKVSYGSRRRYRKKKSRKSSANRGSDRDTPNIHLYIHALSPSR